MSGPARSPAGRRAGGDGSASASALTARWRGEPDRLEVWYSTFSDPASGLACWIHHEVVAPEHRGAPHAVGWIALFEPGQAPVLERFGPQPVEPGDPPHAGDATMELPDAASGPTDQPVVMKGRCGRLDWDVALGPADPPSTTLYTFPSWAWERQALPAAQVVPIPSAPVSGTITLDGALRSLALGTTGNLAHIYGHGSAERWGWLHADLGGGDVLELVTATSRQPGLNRLPPLAFVQLRTDGIDWPRDPLVAAPLFRTRLGLPDWSVRGTVGRWRLTVLVHQPPESTVELVYADPDGSHPRCANSEVADARITLEHRRSRWEEARVWELDGRAHAEVGTRP